MKNKEQREKRANLKINGIKRNPQEETILNIKHIIDLVEKKCRNGEQILMTKILATKKMKKFPILKALVSLGVVENTSGKLYSWVFGEKPDLEMAEIVYYEMRFTK